MHFSEFILYGVFVEGALGSSAEAVAADSMFLHTYWASTPLARRDAEGFVRGLTRDDVAVMISAKSHTPLDVRRAALGRPFADRWDGGLTMRLFDEAAFDRAFGGSGVRAPLAGGAGVLPAVPDQVLGDAAALRGEGAGRRLEVLDIGGGQLRLPRAGPLGGQQLRRRPRGQLLRRPTGGRHRRLPVEPRPRRPAARREFDAIFFSEVIEHLPVPGHVALSRLRALLRPGGLLLCSTPNLYRPRNLVYLIRGQPLFDHFDLPGVRGYGHVLEYSAEHLAWQFGRAGFEDYEVELRDFHHVPHERLDRVLSALGAPLRRIPRFRDNLLAVATAP